MEGLLCPCPFLEGLSEGVREGLPWVLSAATTAALHVHICLRSPLGPGSDSTESYAVIVIKLLHANSNKLY